MNDPADPSRTVGDVDRIEEGVLWEEKSAFWAPDPDVWTERHIIRKFAAYLEMRKYLTGYEQAPIGYHFTGRVNTELRQAVDKAVEQLRDAHPDVDIRLRFEG